MTLVSSRTAFTSAMWPPATHVRPLALDGAYGEGGGRLLRTAVALAAITGRPITVENIRAKRPKPGLAPQHVAAVSAVTALCDARVDGLALRSTALAFAPGRLHGGEFHFDVGTAGSVTLVSQALLPALVACIEPCAVTVTGGTDVRGAPPLDYLRRIMLPLLAHMGVRATLVARRRGYYPRGGGEIVLSVVPSRLQPVAFVEPGAVCRVGGIAHVATIDVEIARRMRDAFLAGFTAPGGIETQIEVVSLTPDEAFGAGGAIVVWAEAEHAVLGAGRVAERGVRAEVLGSAVASELNADLSAGVSLDIHAADQMLVYLALAGGGSFSTRELTTHAQTAIWLLEQFLPVRFDCVADGGRVRVTAATSRNHPKASTVSARAGATSTVANTRGDGPR
jgi:RNA 3'-terminal phosphate cyclase (ATP)